MQILSARVALAALLTLLALGLAACGGGTGDSEVAAANDDGAAAAIEAGSDGGGATSEDSVTLVATEFAYDPSSVTLSAGTPVEIVLDNQGAVEHDVTVEDGDEVVHVAAGDTGSGTLTLEAGSYTFYCSIPGHREAGMEGTITAE